MSILWCFRVIPSPSAPRSERRSGASNAAGPAVAAYGRKPAAHTQPGPASRREEGLTSLRAPRIARTPPPLIRTSPRLGSAVIPYGLIPTATSSRSMRDN